MYEDLEINENRYQKSSKIFQSLNSSKSNIILDSKFYLQLLHDYMELTNKGSSYILNNEFSEALSIYQNALQISEKLKDDYKKNESKCNIGIVNFYLGKLDEAINFIQPCYDYINLICSNQIGDNNIKDLYLFCKSGVNLCMCLLTINSEINNCTTLINNIINIISKEKDINKQLFCSKFMNNSLFRVKSLLNNSNNYFNSFSSYENNYGENNINFMSNEDEYNKLLQFFIESFDNFIHTQKIGPWIKSLNIIYQKMKELNDYSGLIYVLFNQQIAICIKNSNINNIDDDNNNFSVNEETNDAKIKLTALIQAISEETEKKKNYNNNNNNNQLKSIINEEYINNIIDDYKSKLFVIRKIYQMLFSFEEHISKDIQEQNDYNNNSKIIQINTDIPNINNNNNIINDYNNKHKILDNTTNEKYLSLLLKFTKKALNENIQDIQLRNNLLKDINNTLDLIHYKKIDISNINISSIDPEISHYIGSLINNLFLTILKPYFKYFKNKLEKKHVDYSSSKLINFFEKKYNHIYKGENIYKINFNSSGIVEHFYQIDYKNDLFECFPKDPNVKDPLKTYEFNKIHKIMIGRKTDNIFENIKNINIDKKKQPNLFMSFVLNDRTIDLIFKNEKSAKKWFYGLFYYLQISNRSYKICSCTSCILFHIKVKIFNKLQEKIKNINKTTLCKSLKKYFDNYE